MIETFVKIYQTQMLRNNQAILLKPEFLDTSIIYTNKKYIDNDWIKKYIKSEQKNMEYSNNLRTFMF